MYAAILGAVVLGLVAAGAVSWHLRAHPKAFWALQPSTAPTVLDMVDGAGQGRGRHHRSGTPKEFRALDTGRHLTVNTLAANLLTRRLCSAIRPPA